MTSHPSEQEFDNSARFYERADYYKKRQDKSQALSNYVESLKAYYNFANYYTEQNRESRDTRLIYTTFLVEVAGRLKGIFECYDEKTKKAFIVEKIKIISNQLDRYERDFNVEQLELAENLRTFIHNYDSLIQSNQASLKELKGKSKKEIQESDELFAKIRSILTNLSKLPVCPIELDSMKGNDCFIATAAYSTAVHPDLDTFREFKDRKLLTNFLGKQLVSLYYKVGPVLAEYVKKQPVIRKFIKKQLSRLAQGMRRQLNK